MASLDVDEANELRLVNKVELKIALAETDEKLQRLLNVYLPPLILKLASPHGAVQNKVLTHFLFLHVRLWLGPTLMISKCEGDLDMSAC